MTPDLQPERNNVMTGVEIRLQGLSLSPDLAYPITEITDGNVSELRSVLSNAGFNLELSSKGLDSLKTPQLRELETGRGPALVESLGQEKARELFTKCEEIVREYPHVQSFKTGGVGIGLKHTLADLIALSVLPKEDRAKIITNINQRVLYGYKREARDFAKTHAFVNVPPVLEPKKKATVPVGSIIKLWDFITSPSK